MGSQLVSIIIPTFNRSEILSDTLDSIKEQTYKNWECIIVDDGSTDRTEALINEYVASDGRFKFYKRPAEKLKGANACRNYGFKKSEGEFINWFDSDDVMHPNFIKEKLTYLAEDETLDFCACLGQNFIKSTNEAGVPIRPKVLNSTNYLEDYLLKGLFFYTPSPLWRKTFLESKTLFNEKMQRAQESDFHFRMLTYNPKYHYIDKVLFYIRVGGEGITTGASKSFKAQESVFNYFNTVFNHFIHDKTIKQNVHLAQYAFYRQAANYYNLNLLQNNFVGRCSLFFNYSSYLVAYVLKVKTLRKHFFKIIAGLITVLFFKKGYRFFYFPQYDFRSNN